MPHQVSTESSGTGVVIAFSGDVAGPEVVELNDRLASDESFAQCSYQVWDFSTASRLDIAIDELRSISVRDIAASADNPNLKLAIVGPQLLFRGKDRIFLIFEEVWTEFRPKFFEDFETAREWASSDRP